MANLPNITPRILQNTLKLVKLYNTNLKFKELFDRLVPNPKVTYQGQPLKLYLRIITSNSFKYRKYEKEVRADPEKFKELLISFYRDPGEFSKFEKMVQGAVLGKYLPNYLTKEEIELVEKIEQAKDEKEKQQHIAKLEEKLTTSQPKEEQLTEKTSTTPTSQRQLPKISLPKIQLPSFSKDLASWGKIAARKLIYKFGANIFSGTVGTVVAAGLGGGPVGMLAGGGIGGIFPSLLKNSGLFRGGLAVGGKAALGLGVRGAALAAGPPGWIMAAAMSAPQLMSAAKKIMSFQRKVLIYGGASAVVIFILIFADINKINSTLPPFGLIGEAAPLPPGYSEGSSLGYSIPFRDKSVKVANPEAIKQQILSNWPNAKIGNWETIADQSITNGWNPAFVLSLWIEETGAQGTPDYTDPLGCDPDHPTTDINISLSCLFRNFPPDKYSNEKFEDFMCVYGGDGFHKAPCVFKEKNPNFPGNLKEWYSRLVPSGPGSITIQPTTSPSSDLYQALSDKYHIVFDRSIDQKYLTWAWEILTESETTAPNFIPLLWQRLKEQGFTQVKVKTTPDVGERVGDTIYFSTQPRTFFTSSTPSQFKQIFIHELAHEIYGGRGDPTYTNRVEQTIVEDKKFISGYAQGATAKKVVCGSSDSKERLAQLDEDFADNVSYYINKDVTELDYSKICPAVDPSQNPFATKNFPSHLNFIKQLLGGNNF